MHGLFLYKFLLLVILTSLQPGKAQEEQPTSAEDSEGGLAVAFDEIKALLNVIKSKTGAHRREFLSFKNQLEGDLISLRDDLNSLNASMNSFHKEKQQTVDKLAELQASLATTNSKLDTLRDDVSSLNEVNNLTGSLQEQRQETADKLAELQTSLTNTNSKLDILNAKALHISSDLQEIQTNVSNVECVSAEGFLELYKYLQRNQTKQVDNEQENVTNDNVMYTCGGTGGWRRAVYLDMTDNSSTCPSGWQETGYSKRTCGRVANTGRFTCDSVTFSVTGGEYNRVCGRIKAYQYGPTDAFEAYHNGDVTSIDGAYVSGISLTHGSPRQHIWTFAAGISEAEPNRLGQEDACPCDASINIHVPSIVSGSYFCESGVNVGRGSGRTLYPNDPLWDGQNCGTSSTCCSLNSPPYFVKQLPTSTTDDIEARLCILDTQDGEDIAVELIELYVQ